MPLSLIQVAIRRDASTIPSVALFAHELPILHHLYGTENVEAGAVAGTRKIEPTSEYERLVRKYGEEAVISVYGHAPSQRLDAALEPAPPATGKSDVASA